MNGTEKQTERRYRSKDLLWMGVHIFRPAHVGCEFPVSPETVHAFPFLKLHGKSNTLQPSLAQWAQFILGVQRQKCHKTGGREGKQSFALWTSDKHHNRISPRCFCCADNFERGVDVASLVLPTCRKSDLMAWIRYCFVRSYSTGECITLRNSSLRKCKAWRWTHGEPCASLLQLSIITRFSTPIWSATRSSQPERREKKESSTTRKHFFPKKNPYSRLPSFATGKNQGREEPVPKICIQNWTENNHVAQMWLPEFESKILNNAAENTADRSKLQSGGVGAQWHKHIHCNTSKRRYITSLNYFCNFTCHISWRLSIILSLLLTREEKCKTSLTKRSCSFLQLNTLFRRMLKEKKKKERFVIGTTRNLMKA